MKMMNNYLLSIDPSIKNTGFTLGEKKIYCDTYTYLGKPISIGSCSFKKNGIGYETQEHLRGFIAGQFNKLLTKDMLISPSEGKKGYEHYDPPIFGLRPGDKELSIYVAEEIIKENKGDVKVNNHDEADSLLIGGYYLNKENKND